jgi:hypothetical protein
MDAVFGTPKRLCFSCRTRVPFAAPAKGALALGETVWEVKAKGLIRRRSKKAAVRFTGDLRQKEAESRQSYASAAATINQPLHRHAWME